MRKRAVAVGSSQMLAQPSREISAAPRLNLSARRPHPHPHVAGNRAAASASSELRVCRAQTQAVAQMHWDEASGAAGNEAASSALRTVRCAAQHSARPRRMREAGEGERAGRGSRRSALHNSTTGMIIRAMETIRDEADSHNAASARNI